MRLICCFVAAMLCAAQAAAQVQICSPDKIAAYRASLPATESGHWQEIFRDPRTMFYDDETIPAAYQHASGGLINGGQFLVLNGTTGTTTFHSPKHNISGDARERAKGPGRGGNANIEFPWRTPGGTDRSEGTALTFKFMRLPQVDGQTVPIVWWREVSRQSFVGPHSVMAWMFPRGTIFGEVLAQRDSRGQMHTYEVRLRVRERDYWDIAVLRPFPTAGDLANRLAEVGADEYCEQVANVPVVTRKLFDAHHPTKSGFSVDAGVAVLPSMPEALSAHLLDTTPFKVATGAKFAGNAAAPTTNDAFGIVPREYHGSFLGTDTDSCRNCHQHTLMHVDVFDRGRDWYGYVRGSDEIFTFHPINPGDIAYNGAQRQFRLRPEFVAAGMIESYDPTRHAAEHYVRLKE